MVECLCPGLPDKPPKGPVPVPLQGRRLQHCQDGAEASFPLGLPAAGCDSPWGVLGPGPPAPPPGTLTALPPDTHQASPRAEGLSATQEQKSPSISLQAQNC